jgi:putative transcription factor
MCGGSGPLRKTKVEGAKLDLCDDCQDVGDVIETPTPSSSPSTSSSSTTRSRSSRSREPDKELVGDYGRRVKQAREAQDWSVSDLASTLKEKDSVVRRIESGKLSPDQQLATILENALDI